MRIKKSGLFVVLALCAVSISSLAPAAVKMPAVFNNDMVLQREMSVPVWGWADAGEEVTVKFAGQTKTAKACEAGKWMIKLDKMEACAKPAAMTITGAGDKAITLKNVLVGEVWLGSGQSNMEMSVGGCLDVKQFIEKANYPLIRMFTVRKIPSGKARNDVTGQWAVCSPRTVARFSAVSYFFGRRIHKELGVPVGLIHSSWGGTRVEPWTPPCGFASVKSLKGISDQVAGASANYRKQVAGVVDQIEAWLPKAKKALADNTDVPAAPNMPRHPLNSSGAPTGLYNGMIHGLIPYAIRGALWYQGESNGGEGKSYFEKKKALIGGWRKLWAQGDFPFYFVHLASFRQPNADPKGGDVWANVREAQVACLSIPNTGMAVLTDLGDARDIHPKNKQDVGERLALCALAKDYGKKDLVYSGPMYKSFKVNGAKLILSFDHVGGGLMVGKKVGLAPTAKVADGVLKGFAIQGADKKWYWADAKIADGTVILSNENVTKPIAARFAFTTNTAHCNFYNAEGLPGVPFRTDPEWTVDGK
jgi:sialate O-acetylesterase